MFVPEMDTTEFKRASQAVWDAMAPGWDHRNAYFEERARPVTERMLERLAPARGEAILELAAGRRPARPAPPPPGRGPRPGRPGCASSPASTGAARPPGR